MNMPPVDDPALSQTAYAAVRERLEVEARTTAARLGLDWASTMEESPDQHTPARQALTVLMLGLFDEKYYLSTYGDVASSGMNALIHYVNTGDAEGRRPNAVFDPTFYRTQFAPGEFKSVSALYHYAVMGEALGLKASNAFSARRYLVSNTALKPWLDRPLTHYLQLGQRHGLTVNHRARLSSADKVTFHKTAAPSRPDTIDLDDGINLIGPLDRVSGLGVSARGYLDGLRKAGFSRLGCRSPQREFAIQTTIQGSTAFPPYLVDAPVKLVHMNGDTLPIMIKERGEDFLGGSYNIAIWYWELPTLRPEWQVSMKYFHEFWAPTPFIARTLRQSTSKPVRVVPPYLAYLADLQTYKHTPSDHSHFVYCFDANSILERKNPGVLLEAFRLAFPDRQTKVRLTFKVTYPNRKLADVDQLYLAASEDERIQVLDTMMSDSELHRLIGSASAYVSPHRSEGLGLTVIEAMGAGVPVISTPFGGVDAFVTEDTAFPITSKRIELEADYIPYPKGFVWVDPQLESLAANLLFVHTNQDEASKRAIVARERVLNYFCSAELLELYRHELQRVSTSDKAALAVD